MISLTSLFAGTVMMEGNTWKLHDAKARFSELVRRARNGRPQHVTVHGRKSVVVIDAERFEIRPKAPKTRTMAEFIEASKKYRLTDGIDFDRPLYMEFPQRERPVKARTARAVAARYKPRLRKHSTAS